ncbi:hypothetical protein [Bacillus pseudomycoides]|uniref:hypothetical protein n=1 Tax=Bacillus pseudomycoides TaxID=64104 RepID=UPI000BECF395|nr:hypothetical protein [Bacillus pseudomycoides]PEE43611.1 hypothetical protein COO02_04940 [Bacillus pseudomycoides]PEI91166.1 hypothetical protein CN679_15020 [Bacillus pseudomycoides]PGA86863.1 hypothetical protein COL91_23415 [Bacillus pseudomycoides]PHF48895.1 hypothetical protein COF72_09290 [Bacillus pseudomycoides]
MTDKEHIQKTIVESIVLSFRHLGIRIGDACAYASYLTRDLLKEKYNLDSNLIAGELLFAPPLSIGYRWQPPYEFHMWVKLNNDSIDIAARGIKQRDEFQPGGKYYEYRDFPIPIVWDEEPIEGRIYREIENGVDQIDSPVDADVFKQLYEYASGLIDNWNNNR